RSVIVRHTNETLQDLEGVMHIDRVKAAVQKAYQYSINYEAETRVLAPLRMSLGEFRDDGLSKLGPEVFARKLAEIEALRVPLQLLVFGFGAASLGHIFSVDELGQCTERDVEGVYAIGAGSWAALGSLYAKKGFIRGSVEEIIYDLCEAKFVAETSPLVGAATIVFLLYPDGRKMYMPIPKDDRLRSIWERRANRLPP